MKRKREKKQKIITYIQNEMPVNKLSPNTSSSSVDSIDIAMLDFDSIIFEINVHAMKINRKD